MLARALVAGVALVGVAGCPTPGPGTARAPAATPVAEVPVAPAPEHRLGDAVTPRAYRLALDVEPGRDVFRGEVEIDVALNQPMSSVWLHGAELKVERAELRRGGETLTLDTLPAPVDTELIGFGFGRTLAAGPATLVIAFSGAMRVTDGLFHQRYEGAWYAYTDFEPIDARRAFPCFDEPRWKTPWTVTATVPRALVALGNAPVDREEPAGDGRKRVVFRTTPALPSYLVALAVGPFELVEDRGGATPLRIATFPGHSAHARLALEAAAALLPMASRWVDAPMPFPKLDFVAVPIFDGAMENPGLVTVSSQILHVDAIDPEPAAQRLMTLVIAHEIAHMWFGNLVTMAWWDDLWLNEGFATYLADELIEAWRPGWHWELEREAARSRAYDADSLASARALGQPVATRDEIRATFDVLTYIKGGAILEMLEHWLGAAVFRDRVRAYVAQNAWGNVTTGDLVKALGAETGALVRGFVDRGGVPIAAGCGDAAETYRLLGEAAAAQKWALPCTDAGYVVRPPRAMTTARARMQKLEWLRAQVRRGAVRASAAAPAFDIGPVRGSALERQLAALAELEALVAPAVIGPVAATVAQRGIAALGWQRRADDRLDDREVRPALIETYGRHVPRLPADVRASAQRWLRNRRGLDPELAAAILVAVAVRGDRALHGSMLSELDRERDQDHRDALIAGLASFADDALLARSLALAVDPRLPRLDAVKLLYKALEGPHTRARAYAFVRDRRPTLDKLHRTTPVLARFACSADEVAVAESLLAEFTAQSPEQERLLEQIAREYQTCERLRRHERATEAQAKP